MTTMRIGAAFTVLTAIVLAACGQKSEAPETARKADASPVTGANAAYSSAGWKVGDATSWEQHMRTRTQQQNEYNRMEAARR
jgi:hypothetical protein